MQENSSVQYKANKTRTQLSWFYNHPPPNWNELKQQWVYCRNEMTPAMAQHVILLTKGYYRAWTCSWLKSQLEYKCPVVHLLPIEQVYESIPQVLNILLGHLWSHSWFEIRNLMFPRLSDNYRNYWRTKTRRGNLG